MTTQTTLTDGGALAFAALDDVLAYTGPIDTAAAAISAFLRRPGATIEEARQVVAFVELRRKVERAAWGARSPRKYHALLARHDGGAWGVEFGSFTRSDVVAERADYREHGHKARDLKVVACAGNQASIDAVVAMTNATEV